MVSRIGSNLNALLLITCLIVILTGNTKVTAQRTNDVIYRMILPPEEWSEGSILLNDGTELMGPVRYNDKNGLIAFESGGTSRSFSSRNVVTFEFFDTRQNRRRIYYAIELKDKQTDIMQPIFVEVLKDFETFAIVARMEPVGAEERSSRRGPFAQPNSPNMVTGQANGIPIITPLPDTKTFKQIETIYFLNSDWTVEPFVEITHIVKDGILRDVDKKKGKVLDQLVMSRYFKEPGYSMLLDFIDENNLDLEKRTDLLKALDFYADFN